ncbi:vWA domain-containing protein [Xanthobacter sp. V4C-4]|uniref:vWA domain-containing protein n=1 Tax=Xanthobacter cornucopiae TaxID=3119924 RepID=UPI00372CBCC4
MRLGLGLGVDHPVVLALLILAVLPVLAGPFRGTALPALVQAPTDRLSAGLGVALKMAGIVAIAALVLGLAGLHRSAVTITRLGPGAHLMLLLDRSASMDNTFANRQPGQGEESKSAAAKRLLTNFLARRPRDSIGVAAFSTSPLPVLPLTDHHDAVAAAVAAIDRPGLALTDVGRGLVLALQAFEDTPAATAGAVLLVSDGAALVDPRVQAALRDALARRPTRLYWLFLRTAGAHGIFDPPSAPGEDKPQVMPERHLNLFLASLGVPYRAFEAASPQAVADAIAEIDRQESAPVLYDERLARRDLATACYAVAALALALLTAAKLAERDLSPEPAKPRAESAGASSDTPERSAA